MQVLAEKEKSSSASNLRAQRAALWSSPAVALVLLVLFVAFPGFFPPMSPGMTAAEVGAFYQDNTALIRFSMVGFNLCGIMLVPFFVLIMAQMQRMKGQSHIYAFSYLTAVVAGATLFALSNIFFAVAAFRPDRGDELVQVLNDLAWITFIAPIGMLVAQFVLLALAVYADDDRTPVFPRWVGHYALLTALAMAPSAGAAVFRAGPLAWDGLVSFWLRNGAFALFVLVMFFVVRTALRRQAEQEGS
ncbi:hypothetical protein DPM19_25710 [Actinomadura craniellae]|uniref:DUF4386 domain-containing protein n=1 Tax=Actinomadura craniellae TaxID=2231787 RepID=A0A365H0G1_9ACTN|nr:hypothetical protein [Actinomadura craniellae]RAY12526.1 hypothetical protein DPM19_25710 [Actinomadura craniellae]